MGTRQLLATLFQLQLEAKMGNQKGFVLDIQLFTFDVSKCGYCNIDEMNENFIVLFKGL